MEVTCFVHVQQTILGQVGPCSRSDRDFAWKIFPRFIKKQSTIVYDEVQFYCILKESCVAFRFAKLDKENFLYDTLFNFNIKNMHYYQIAYF